MSRFESNASPAIPRAKAMAVSKQSRGRSTGRQGTTGLLANGCSGPWEIAIDQTISGPTQWFMQLEGPSVYLAFEVPSLALVDHELEFLGGLPGKSSRRAVMAGRNGTMVLGTSKIAPVSLVGDDEFSDRFFLVIQPKGGLIVRFTLAGDDLRHVVEALRQVREDIV
jgi:hypothetical protein